MFLWLHNKINIQVSFLPMVQSVMKLMVGGTNLYYIILLLLNYEIDIYLYIRTWKFQIKIPELKKKILNMSTKVIMVHQNQV